MNDTDKIIDVQVVNNDHDRPEPFATVLDLISEHGTYALLEAIFDNADFDSEDDEMCPDCRMRAARLRLELEQLLDRMDDFDDAICQPDNEEPGNEPAAH